jgi:hypothetical protein
MPNPNAVVGLPTRVEADVFEIDGRRVRLDPDRPGRRSVVEGAARQRLPVYIEIDPATATITRMFLPHVTRVRRMQPVDEGIAVEVELSHAVHVLRRDAPDYESFELQLRESLGNGRVIVVTEDDARNIIDVRTFRPGPDGPMPEFPTTPPRPPSKLPWPLDRLRELLIRIWRWRWWPWWWFSLRCVSPAHAQQVFDAMAATNCAPLTVPAPCIPFMYPDNFCWARAHEMCRLMLGMNVQPRKVWINGPAPVYLKADSRNHPDCFVKWSWHVAPTICVRRWRWFFFFSRELVIDPSLCTTPVTKADWKALQNNANATLTDTDWTYYWQSGATDPVYTQTNQHLGQARLALLNRSVGPAGPPPYAHCP